MMHVMCSVKEMMTSLTAVKSEFPFDQDKWTTNKSSDSKTKESNTS